MAKIWLADQPSARARCQALQARGLLPLPSAVTCFTVAAAGVYAAASGPSAVATGSRLHLERLGLPQAICMLLLLPGLCALDAAAGDNLNPVPCTWQTKMSLLLCMPAPLTSAAQCPAGQCPSLCMPATVGRLQSSWPWLGDLFMSLLAAAPAAGLKGVCQAPGTCCHHKHRSGTLSSFSAHLLQVLAWSGCGPGWQATQRTR